MFYGFVAIIAVGIIYSYRQQMEKHLYLLYGFGGLSSWASRSGHARRRHFVPSHRLQLSRHASPRRRHLVEPRYSNRDCTNGCSCGASRRSYARVRCSLSL